jgi:hypothetical protein
MVVSFAGTTIGAIIGFDEDFSASEPTDKTGSSATIVGTGANTRVILQQEITAINPGVLSFRCWGNPPFTRTDIGLRGTLSFSVGGVSWSETAQLANFKRIGSAGEKIQGSYQFSLTG